jgi:hypothetical protein
MYTCNARNVSQTADAEKNANRRLVINKYLNAETLQVLEELARSHCSVIVLYCDSRLCVRSTACHTGVHGHCSVHATDCLHACVRIESLL